MGIQVALFDMKVRNLLMHGRRFFNCNQVAEHLTIISLLHCIPYCFWYLILEAFYLTQYAFIISTRRLIEMHRLLSFESYGLAKLDMLTWSYPFAILSVDFYSILFERWYGWPLDYIILWATISHAWLNAFPDQRPYSYGTLKCWDFLSHMSPEFVSCMHHLFCILLLCSSFMPQFIYMPSRSCRCMETKVLVLKQNRCSSKSTTLGHLQCFTNLLPPIPFKFLFSGFMLPILYMYAMDVYISSIFYTHMLAVFKCAIGFYLLLGLLHNKFGFQSFSISKLVLGNVIWPRISGSCMIAILWSTTSAGTYGFF